MRYRTAGSNREDGEGTTGQLNTFGLGECIVYFDEGDAGSMEIKLCEIQLADGRWVALSTAKRKKYVITDNPNTCFFEPTTEEDRERGYTLL